MHRVKFYDIIFYIFDNWRKREISMKIKRNYQCSAQLNTNVSKVGGKQYPLKFLLVNIRYRNSFKLKLTYFVHKDNVHIELKKQQTDFLKRVREIHRSRSYFSVCPFLIFGMFRSSRPEVFWKKGVLRNFAKFTGIHLCQSHHLSNMWKTAYGVLS